MNEPVEIHKTAQTHGFLKQLRRRQPGHQLNPACRVGLSANAPSATAEASAKAGQIRSNPVGFAPPLQIRPHYSPKYGTASTPKSVRFWTDFGLIRLI